MRKIRREGASNVQETVYDDPAGSITVGDNGVV
jgi:hypothetical protein